jgi:hypothetical protein
MTINFTTINEDGEKKNWSMTTNELQEKYWSEDEDLPNLEDEVTEFSIEDALFDSFENIVMAFLGGID